MCVIIFANTGLVIEEAIMRNAVERNPHGWGMVAYKRPKNKPIESRVLWGLGFDDAWKHWCELGAEWQRVFHARVSTSGAINAANQHPFDASYDGIDKEGKPVSEERWFFHNGVIRDFPELDEDMCDSWHLATYIQAFPTSKKMVDTLARHAVRNNSRYVLSTPEVTWYMGDGWLERKGVLYSNASALSGSKVGGSNSPKEGGAFDDEAEITSKTFVAGFGYDSSRQLYTNKKRVSDYGRPRGYWDGGQGKWVDDQHEWVDDSRRQSCDPLLAARGATAEREVPRKVFKDDAFFKWDSFTNDRQWSYWLKVSRNYSWKQVDDNKITPEEYNRFWQQFDKLQDAWIKRRPAGLPVPKEYEEIFEEEHTLLVNAAKSTSRASIKVKGPDGKEIPVSELDFRQKQLEAIEEDIHSGEIVTFDEEKGLVTLAGGEVVTTASYEAMIREEVEGKLRGMSMTGVEEYLSDEEAIRMLELQGEGVATEIPV